MRVTSRHLGGVVSLSLSDDTFGFEDQLEYTLIILIPMVIVYSVLYWCLEGTIGQYISERPIAVYGTTV